MTQEFVIDHLAGWGLIILWFDKLLSVIRRTHAITLTITFALDSNARK
jgi:hypothetical protein